MSKPGINTDKGDAPHHRPGGLPLGWGTGLLAQMLPRGVTVGDASTAAGAFAFSGEFVRDFVWPEVGSETEWALYSWRPPRDKESRQPRGVGIATFARRLMAVERTRMQARTAPGTAGRQKSPRPGVAG